VPAIGNFPIVVLLGKTQNVAHTELVAGPFVRNLCRRERFRRSQAVIAQSIIAGHRCHCHRRCCLENVEPILHVFERSANSCVLVCGVSEAGLQVLCRYRARSEYHQAFGTISQHHDARYQ
jgi:hypothetical protein